MGRRVDSEMTVSRPGKTWHGGIECDVEVERVLHISGIRESAEPGVGISNPYIDDLVAVDEYGEIVTLSDGEEERAQGILLGWS